MLFLELIRVILCTLIIEKDISVLSEGPANRLDGAIKTVDTIYSIHSVVHKWSSPMIIKKTGFYLYADDTCIFYQHENFKKVWNVLNKELSSLCQKITDNKL